MRDLISRQDVPDINVGDMISRKDAIDLVKDVCDAIMSGCDSHYDSETGDEVYNDILEVDAILKCNKEIRIALANLASAEERKRGKWIIYIPEHGKCPFCGNQVDLYDGMIHHYCNECGAELGGE